MANRTSRLIFTEDKPLPRLSHGPRSPSRSAFSAAAHRKLREYEDDNAGLESAHRSEEAAESGIRALTSSRRQQRRAIKKGYAAARRTRSAGSAAGTAGRTAKAIQKARAFAARHKKALFIAGGIAVFLLIFSSVISSGSMMLNGLSGTVTSTTYPSADADMLAAEARYCALEEALKARLENYETEHRYSEYRFELDEIGHDPYVLISAITALYGGAWTVDQVDGIIQTLFERQYILSESVTAEARPREGGGKELYTVCEVRLENFNLSHVPVYIMSEDQLAVYAMYMGTLGNRPDLFGESSYVARYYNHDYTRYTIPPAALKDKQFAAMIAEAEKYLGYPYVWGGCSPETSFDCSGFVSWVINHCGVGWNFGRRGTDSLYFDICTPIAPSQARPGDLIFFEKTYDTPNTSHVGIYVGDGMMIHCGDPIQYASINTGYWQAHFYGFGRLPTP